MFYHVLGKTFHEILNFHETIKKLVLYTVKITYTCSSSKCSYTAGRVIYLLFCDPHLATLNVSINKKDTQRD